MQEDDWDLPIGELQAGSVLAADVVDARGALIIRAGTQLTERLLKAIKQRGITSVVLADEEAVSPSRKQKVLDRLEAQYAAFDDDLTMQLLKTMFVRYYLRGFPE